jgi:alpha-beta hydrolase superfamily lysophospholipase
VTLQPSLLINHGEGEFSAPDGLKLFRRWWLPELPARAVIIMVHGLADHSGRHANLARRLAPLGFAVHAFDLRGHGKSDGPRCDVQSFDQYGGDLAAFIEIIGKEHPGRPLFLAGHSMGGTIAFTLAAQKPLRLSGIVLFSPAVHTSAAPAALVSIAPLVARLLPGLGLYALEASAISRNRPVVESYVNDPLVYHGKIKARLGVGLLEAMRRLPPLMPGFSLPLLVLHGTADRMVDPAGSRLLYRRAGSKDKTLKAYGGCYHELFNEPEKDKVLGDVADWLLARLPD